MTPDGPRRARNRRSAQHPGRRRRAGSPDPKPSTSSLGRPRPRSAGASAPDGVPERRPPAARSLSRRHTARGTRGLRRARVRADGARPVRAPSGLRSLARRVSCARGSPDRAQQRALRRGDRRPALRPPYKREAARLSLCVVGALSPQRTAAAGEIQASAGDRAGPVPHPLASKSSAPIPRCCSSSDATAPLGFGSPLFLPGSNCELAWSASRPSPTGAAATISWRAGSGAGGGRVPLGDAHERSSQACHFGPERVEEVLWDESSVNGPDSAQGGGAFRGDDRVGAASVLGDGLASEHPVCAMSGSANSEDP
jgi:hypothetical protein